MARSQYRVEFLVRDRWVRLHPKSYDNLEDARNCMETARTLAILNELSARLRIVKLTQTLEVVEEVQ